MSSIINFDYKGNQIPFEKGKDVLVNLTAMAKAYPDKNLSTIVNSLEIKEYINALTELKNFSSADLLIVRKGGDISQQGTWAHRLVAIRVAQKLNPALAVWVDMKIEELLTTGVATVSNDDEAIAYAMQVLNKRLEANKQQLQIAHGTIEVQQEQINILVPKAEYTDDVLQATSTYTFTQMAKELNFTSANTFISHLKEMNIIYKQSGQYQLTSKYAGQRYTATRTARYFHSDGKPDTSISTVWTERGRAFLHNLLKCEEVCYGN